MKDNKIFFPQVMTEDLAEEVGLHLGDGSMNFYNGKGFYSLRGHMIDDKLHYKIRIKPLYKKLYNIDVRLREMPSTKVYGFQIWSDELVDFKHHNLGLPLGPKRIFLLPLTIAENDEFSRSFLRGFFDTDGCIYLEHKNHKLYPRIEMVSICEEFMKQLKKIILRLGFRVTYEKRFRPLRHNFPEHKLSIRGIEMTKKWFSEIRPSNPKHVLKYNRLNLK